MSYEIAMDVKVFISSVIEGYEDKRQAAKDAVYELQGLDFPIRPIMTEDFPAHNKSPQEACKTGVLESDIYVGILGARYGWINPASSLSATHEEYRIARNRGKTILIFIENCEKEPRQCEFVREVEDYVEGKFRKIFSNADELKHEVHKALLKVLAQRLKAEPALHIDPKPTKVDYTGAITPVRKHLLENLYDSPTPFFRELGRPEEDREASWVAIVEEIHHWHRQGLVELIENNSFNFTAYWTYRGLRHKQKMQPYLEGKVEQIFVFRVENQGGRRAEECQANYELFNHEGNRWRKSEHREYIGFVRSLEEIAEIGWGKNFLSRVNLNSGDHVYLVLCFPYDELRWRNYGSPENAPYRVHIKLTAANTAAVTLDMELKFDQEQNLHLEALSKE